MISVLASRIDANLYMVNTYWRNEPCFRWTVMLFHIIIRYNVSIYFKFELFKHVWLKCLILIQGAEMLVFFHFTVGNIIKLNCRIGTPICFSKVKLNKSTLPLSTCSHSRYRSPSPQVVSCRTWLSMPASASWQRSNQDFDWDSSRHWVIYCWQMTQTLLLMLKCILWLDVPTMSHS